jgi:tRNA(Arg) A34 adenosine deaminase TadA
MTEHSAGDASPDEAPADHAASGDAPAPPSAAVRYTAEEERAMREAVLAGTLPPCPRCAVAMTRRPIGGGSFGLGYHRQREWLLCPSCRRSAIFDVKRGTRL